MKRMMAEERGFETGDKAIVWIANQIMETFFASNRVEEVYSEDFVLRRKIVLIFATQLGIEEEVEKEVREKLKNLEEGSPEWDIEYQKLYKQIARRKGLI